MILFPQLCRHRNYAPLLQSISKRGDLPAMERLLEHMTENGVAMTEEVFDYRLQNCLSARSENQFIRCLHAMCSACPIVEREETLSLLNEFTQKSVCSIDRTADFLIGACVLAILSTRENALTAENRCNASCCPPPRRSSWPTRLST